MLVKIDESGLGDDQLDGIEYKRESMILFDQKSMIGKDQTTGSYDCHVITKLSDRII